MTVEDLRKLHSDYILANLEQGNGNAVSLDAMRVVVRALRDELSKCDWDEGENMIDALDEILGDAGEKVGTHGSPELDEDARKLEAMGQDPGMTLEELLEPSTDAAPAVCVWTPYTDENLGANWWRSCGGVRHRYSFDGHHPCTSCGKPIKFTEAKA